MCMKAATSYRPASPGRSISLPIALSLALAIAPSLLHAQTPQAPATHPRPQANPSQAQKPQAQTPLAFPGAEGYGATATGGRGKPAIAVTTLADDGPGSFRDAARHPGATIVFRVGGVVHLKSNMTLASNLTIAGQTAPGSGITVAGGKVTMNGSSNIIIRYMRFRGGLAESPGSSSLQLGDASHVMLDHLSIEWGRWDNIQAEGNSYSTLQNSVIGEGIVPQRFGCLCESDYTTFSHNLWIDNKSRNPKGKGHIQYVNNVVYNWGGEGYVGGHGGADHYADLVGNYFIAGPDSSASFIGEFAKTDHTYQSGNLLDADRNGKLDGRPVTQDDFEKVKADVVEKPFASPEVPVHVDPAASIVGEIARQAGDSLCRDAVDARLTGDLLSFGLKGKLIADESEVGGNPATVDAQAPADSDGDGIPDAWELQHHLNPHNPADAAAIELKTGYTNLEIYLNQLAAQPIRPCPQPR
jgi:pectate lyase